jgi:hypothetical protein
MKVKGTFVSSFLEEQEKKQKNSLRNLTRTMGTTSLNPNHAVGVINASSIVTHSHTAEISYPSRSKAVNVLVLHV